MHQSAAAVRTSRRVDLDVGVRSVGRMSESLAAVDGDSLLSLLRSQQAIEPRAEARARLLHECAVLEEQRGDHAAALEHDLAALELAPDFREPREALIRRLSRRGSSSAQLGDLFELGVRLAERDDERAEAHRARAAFQLDVEHDLEAARASLESAVASRADDAAAWVELSVIAAKQKDAAELERTLAARAGLSADGRMRSVLSLELASLAARRGDFAAAYQRVETAMRADPTMKYRATLLWEHLANANGDGETAALALEARAETILAAIEAPNSPEAWGVPRFVRDPAHVVAAWLGAAARHRSRGAPARSAGLLEHARRLLPESAVVARSQIRSLLAAGALDRAAELAEREVARDPASRLSAGLWFHIAESRRTVDAAEAIVALDRAIEADAGSIPARVRQMEAFVAGDDPTRLSQALAASAETFSSSAARGRTLALSALVLVSAHDRAGADHMLAKARAAGASGAQLARVARSFASLSRDAQWLEQSLDELVAATGDSTERTHLSLELGRSRLLRGDREGAVRAFAELANASDATATRSSAWLGLMLAAFAPEAQGSSGALATSYALRRVQFLERLVMVEPDPGAARAFAMVAAIHKARGGDISGARAGLEERHAAARNDVGVAVLSAGLARLDGDDRAASDALATSAAACASASVGAALRIEAALLAWRTGDRSRAIALLEQAAPLAPRAASALLRWAVAGLDPDGAEARRRMLDTVASWGADASALELERFALEALGTETESGSALAAMEAIGRVQAKATGDIADAAALARLLFTPALRDRSGIESAFERIGSRGREALALVGLEGLRLAAEVDRDPLLASHRAERWFTVEPRPRVALGWLAAAIAGRDRAAEIAARRALMTTLGDSPPFADLAGAVAAFLGSTPARLPPLSAEARLANLEVSPPGGDPRRRSSALLDVQEDLPIDARLDVIRLAAWNELAAGAHVEALSAFRAIVDANPDDLASWEGVRAAASRADEPRTEALACAKLGALCLGDERAAAYFEQAANLLLDRTDDREGAEIAFENALARDPRRTATFDRLLRLARERGDNEKVMRLIDSRIEVTTDRITLGRLHWERARMLRNAGRRDAALEDLQRVTKLDPDRAPALALAAEILIGKGEFAKAAPLLKRFASSPLVPAQPRLAAGIAAADLYETRLRDPEKSLEILIDLHRAGLSTLAVRERLARAAAKAGAWAEATVILEQLMNERATRKGRAEAARLAMVIHRDCLRQPLKAEKAVAKLLEENQSDAEALALVATTSFEGEFRSRVIRKAKGDLLQALERDPTDPVSVGLLAKLASTTRDLPLRKVALGAMVALGSEDESTIAEIMDIAGRTPSRPTTALDARSLQNITDPDDCGPIAELFAQLADCLGLVFGPTLESLEVSRRDRVELRGGHPLRLAVAEWVGALGDLGEWDLYVGGKDPHGVIGVPGEVPALVLGSAILLPLDAPTRGAVAREVYALLRGTTIVRSWDASAVACVVAAACQEAGFNVPAPPFSVWAEISRGVRKELSRNTRRAIVDPCQRIVRSDLDGRAWTEAAIRSLDRVALVASGDIPLVLDEILGDAAHSRAAHARENPRARRLLSFAFSRSYLELRERLGMGAR